MLGFYYFCMMKESVSGCLNSWGGLRKGKIRIMGRLLGKYEHINYESL